MMQSEILQAPSQPLANAPAQLLPVCASAAERAKVLPLLQSAGLDWADDDNKAAQPQAVLAQRDIAELSDLTDRVAASPDVHLLIFVPIPILDIARRMAKGDSPRQALAQWMQASGSLLGVVRSCRRRSSVFFVEAALSNPAGFVEVLAQRLKLELEFGAPEDLTPELPKAVLRMLAENALWQSQEARYLAAELEATALPVPTQADFLLPAADQVFIEYQKTVDTPAQMARELREENGLLLEQLQRVQQKMEAFTVEKKNIENRLSSAEQYKVDLEKTRHQLAQVQSQALSVDELKEENELLLAQLHQVQEELETYFLKTKTAEDHAAQAQTRIKQLTDELESSSLKAKSAEDQAAQAQACIKQLDDELANLPKIKELQEENELLLQQLHHVQEELENYYLKSQDSDRQLADCRNELAHIHDELNIANSAVNALRNSLSWKITAPMRAILGVFVGGKDKQASKT